MSFWRACCIYRGKFEQCLPAFFVKLWQRGVTMLHVREEQLQGKVGLDLVTSHLRPNTVWALAYNPRSYFVEMR